MSELKPERIFLICDARAGIPAQCSDFSPIDHATNQESFSICPLQSPRGSLKVLGSCRGDVEVPGKRALPSSSHREALFLMTTYTGLLEKFKLNSVST